MRAGWETEKLGDVILPIETVDPRKTPTKRFRYVDVSSVSNETFEVIEAVEILGKEAPSRARRKIRSGDVIFATIRPTLKRIAIIPAALDAEVCSTGYFVFRTKPFLDSRFLFYHLLTDEFLDAMGRLQTGASYPAVNDTQIRQQEISYPPLPEQQRIVAVLDEAFAGLATAISNTEKNLKSARELFDSYLNSVFRKRGDGWTEENLGDVCQFQGGSQPPKSKFSSEKKDGYVRLIQIRDYKSNRFAVYIPKSLTKKFCTAEDVMIGRYGPPLFQILRGLDGAYNVALMKAIPDEGVLSKDFLFYFLKNSEILSYIIRSSSRAAGQSGLNKETIEPYPIAFPSLSKQTEIVRSLQKCEQECERLESCCERKLAAIAALKQSILQKAFSGELTSPPSQALSEAAE